MEELFNQERITLKDLVPPIIFKIARKLDNAKLADRLVNLGEPYLTEIIVGLMVLSSILLGVIVSSTLPSTVAQLTAALRGKYNVKLTADAYQKIYSLEVQRLQAKNQNNTPNLYKQGAVLGATDVKDDSMFIPVIRRLATEDPYKSQNNQKRSVDETSIPESSIFDIWEDEEPDKVASADSTLTVGPSAVLTNTEAKDLEQSVQVLGVVDNSNYNAADYYSYF